MENFVMKTKKTIKKIAAIGSGVLMAATPALAVDLGDYPAPFVQAGQLNGLLVLGADGKADDLVGSIEVAGTLAQVAGGGPGGISVSGGASEEVTLGDALADFFTTTLDDTDIDTLFDGKIDFADEELDTHEEIRLGAASPSLETSSTSDDDYGSDPVIEVTGAGSIGYFYVFDDVVDWDDDPTDVSDTDPLSIDFLGNALEITDVDDADTITAQVGEEVYMKVGDTVTIEGSTVQLVDVSSGDAETVIVSVDGTQEIVTGTEKVDGLRVRVKERFVSDVQSERAAVLVIGTDAVKTYDSGDEYTIPCGEPATSDCDEDDPDWEWVIDMDEVTGGGAPDEIGIESDFTWNSVNKPVIHNGERIVLPEGNVFLSFDSLVVNNFQQFEIFFEESVDLSDAGGDAAVATSEDVITIRGPDEDSLGVDTDDDGDMDIETDTLYLWVDVSDDAVELLYIDDDNDVAFVLADSDETNTLEAEDTVAEDPIEFYFIYGDTEMRAALFDSDEVDGGGAADGNVDPILGINVDEGDDSLGDLGDDDGDLYIDTDLVSEDIDAVGNAFVGFNTAEQADAADALFGDYDDTPTEIGERDNPVLFVYGVYTGVPEDDTENDEFNLWVPEDLQEANIVIGTSGTSVVSGAGGVSVAGVQLSRLDTEVSNPAAQNVILVGGTAVNRLTASALGVDYPTVGAAAGTALSIGPDQATLKLIENAFGGTNVALIVAGWEGPDTRAAASVLKDFGSYRAQLDGKMQVTVTGPAGAVQISSPQVSA